MQSLCLSYLHPHSYINIAANSPAPSRAKVLCSQDLLTPARFHSSFLIHFRDSLHSRRFQPLQEGFVSLSDNKTSSHATFSSFLIKQYFHLSILLSSRLIFSLVDLMISGFFLPKCLEVFVTECIMFFGLFVLLQTKLDFFVPWTPRSSYWCYLLISSYDIGVGVLSLFRVFMSKFIKTFQKYYISYKN